MHWKYFTKMFGFTFPGNCVLLLLASVQLSDGWILSLSPDTKCGKCSTKMIGDSITFTCSVVMEAGDADKMATISLRWLNQMIKPVELAAQNTISQRVYSNQTAAGSLHLHITNIKETDAGSYTCEATSSLSGNRLKRPTSLVVIKDVKIKFLETPETQYPRVNGNALIRCMPDATPQPVITWYFKGEPLVNGGRYTFAENGLIIHRLTKQDEGVYICNAEMPLEHRLANRSITVIPASTPMITKPLNDVIGAFGHVRVKCMASGKPVPNYHWFKSGSADMLLEPKYHVDNDTGILVINNLSPSDEGKYICIASNPAGDTIATVDVKNVTVFPSAMVIGKKSFARGENLTLDCRVTGHPFPKVYWYISDGSVPWPPESISADNRIRVEWRNKTNLQLSIRNVTSADSGTFLCMVENTAGSQNNSATIIINSVSVADDGNTPPTKGSSVLNAAWGASLGIIFVIALLVICSVLIRRHRSGQRVMSSNMVVCSSCLVCIRDNTKTRGSTGGSLNNASSKEKIAFSELIDTPDSTRKERLSVISTSLPCGKDNDISPDAEETDFDQSGEYDNNSNKGKRVKKIDIKEGGYTELPLV